MFLTKSHFLNIAEFVKFNFYLQLQNYTFYLLVMQFPPHVLLPLLKNIFLYAALNCSEAGLLLNQLQAAKLKK